MELEKQLYNFILDFWRLVKKYAKQPSSAEAWDELLRESDGCTRSTTGETLKGAFIRIAFWPGINICKNGNRQAKKITL